jgi:Serine dehydrogenase proteinase
MANQANIINLLTKAAEQFNDTLDDDASNSVEEEVTPIDYASMTDVDREEHLKSFRTQNKNEYVKYLEEYTKCYDCREIVVPRRKEDTGFFSFFGTSTKTLTEIDATNFINDIREIEEANVDRDTPFNLHIFLDTNGGRLATAEIICKTLLQYEGRIKVFVNNHAMSAGTLIALCGHEIYLRSHAYLGCIDPQMGTGYFWLPANAVDHNNDKLEEFETPWVRDMIRGLAGPANNANERVSGLFDRIAKVRQWSPEFKSNISRNLLDNSESGGYGHDRPYDYLDLMDFWTIGISDETNNPSLSKDWPTSAKCIRNPLEVKKPANNNSTNYMSMLGL